jgi:putative Mg2+ transporter-C (MgtC) family protein
MDSFINFSELLNNYWSNEQLTTNFIIFMNLAGSLVLGMLLGLERTIRGRAAGLRTYGLVAAASCAMTVFTGYPHYWFGGTFPLDFYPDPTRVIQGVVTGVGFLGAGVIMKDGFSITGLSTAASIWMCSAIGILVGVGFYGAGITLTLLSVLTLAAVAKIEQYLPHTTSYAVQLIFKEGSHPSEQDLKTSCLSKGYVLSENGINVSMKNGQIVWKFQVHTVSNQKCHTITDISNELSESKKIIAFDISKTRI